MKSIPDGKKWKYARHEYERCFLLKGKPLIPGECLSVVIDDRYIDQSNLRLRQVQESFGTHYKLTKKVRMNEQPGSVRWISSIYISQTKYLLLSVLQGINVTKRRYKLDTDNGPIIGIDHYELEERSLWFAEVEFYSISEMTDYKLPFEYDREVTDIQQFSGYELAKLANQGSAPESIGS